MCITDTDNHPYDVLYLNPLMDLHRLVFLRFMENEEHDFFSLIDNYMQTSDIRAKMDVGNWSALNKCDKQVINSVDMSNVTKKDPAEVIDYFIMHWMADIYTLFQWMYNIPSKEINDRIPAKKLYKIYYPLHETSEKNACEKLYHTFFEDFVGTI